MYGISIEFDVPVPMRDGTVLRADVYRPSSGGPHPVLVQRSPYDKLNSYEVMHDFLHIVRAGYIMVFQDTRGRFESDGEWIPLKHERDDGFDTIEWAAAMPGSNGKVGMVGMSYKGSTQWSAAIARPPHLEAIAPIFTHADPADGLMFRGGAIELGLNAWWGPLVALTQYPRAGLPPEELDARTGSAIADFDALATEGYWGLPSGRPPVIARTGQPDTGVARALEDPDSLAESRVTDWYARLNVPSLAFAGWYDLFQQGSIDNYVGMRSKGRTARLVVGPWSHYFNGSAQTGAVNFGLASTMPNGQTITDMHLDWFSHWLRGDEATSAHESGVLVFVMGVNQWRAEPEWPLARATDTPLYLSGADSLSWEAPRDGQPPSEYDYDPENPTLTHGGAFFISSEFVPGPQDQAATEARDDVLIFTTAPLEEDLEVTGRVRATLFASTDGPSTDWVLRLCDINEQGVSYNVADGITRVITEPGRVDEVEVDLWSTSIVFRAGHRIRVQVTSSNFPRWDRNLNTGESVTEGTTMRVAHQRIFHSPTQPSRLSLPVVAS
ncbi:MAG: CocE/NonD family hydrolase [Mycetocola sp.]